MVFFVVSVCVFGNDDDVVGIGLFVVLVDVLGVLLCDYWKIDGGCVVEVCLECVVLLVDVVFGVLEVFDGEVGVELFECVFGYGLFVLLVEVFGVMDVVKEYMFDYLCMCK